MTTYHPYKIPDPHKDAEIKGKKPDNNMDDNRHQKVNQ